MMLSQIDRQIIRFWRREANARIDGLLGRPARAGGPRIAVIGNCQSYGIAYGMKLHDPTATVDHYSAIGHTRVSIDHLARTLSRYDCVFSHDWPEGHVRGGGSTQLKELVPKTVMIPTIVFAAFHPDLVYINDIQRPGAFVDGPLRPYHSGLALFAYRKGLSVEEACALFNDDVFTAVGYFDVWDKASCELIDYSKNAFGVDLSAELSNWSRRGVFMLSILHPKGFVLHDLARLMLRAAGIEPRAINTGYYDIDDLARSEIFPVYPPIAKMFGVPGSYLFKAQNHHLSNGVGEFLSLQQFVAACYRVYEKHKPEQLYNARVDGWLADSTASDALARLARENLRTGKARVF